MTLQESDFVFIRDLVLRRFAIVLETGKEYLVEARLSPVARDAGFAGIPELVEALRRHPTGPLGTRVVEAMTTNETSFFRDNHPFEALRSHVIPKLIERNRLHRSIQVWSAVTAQRRRDDSPRPIPHGRSRCDARSRTSARHAAA